MKKIFAKFKVGILVTSMILAFFVSLFSHCVTLSTDKTSGYYLYDNITETYTPAGPEYHEDYVYYDRIIDAETGNVIYTPVEIDTSFKVFDPDKLADTEFWITFVCITGASLAIYYCAYVIVKDKLLRSEEYKTFEDKYNDRLKLKRDSFYVYVRENNLEEKKRVYKEKYNGKLQATYTKLGKIPNEKMKTRKAIHLQKKIEYYKMILDPGYIDEHILGVRIRYEEIKASNFRNSALSSISLRKDKSEEAKRMAFISARKVITATIWSSLVAMMIIEKIVFQMETTSFIILLITTMVSSLLQIIFGGRDSRKMYQEEYISVLDNKTRILEEYSVWSLKHPDKSEDNFRDIISKYVDDKMKKVEESKKEDTQL